MMIMLAFVAFRIIDFSEIGNIRNGMYLINNAIDLGCLRDPS